MNLPNGLSTFICLCNLGIPINVPSKPLGKGTYVRATRIVLDQSEHFRLLDRKLIRLWASKMGREDQAIIFGRSISVTIPCFDTWECVSV